jgi:hypothetical protein
MSEPLYYVRCNGDGSWLTKRPNPHGSGDVFAMNPSDAALVTAAQWPKAAFTSAGVYQLIPTPFVTPLPKREVMSLNDALTMGRRALKEGSRGDIELALDTLIESVSATVEEGKQCEHLTGYWIDTGIGSFRCDCGYQFNVNELEYRADRKITARRDR